MRGKEKNLCQHVVRLCYRAYMHFLSSRYGEDLNIVAYGKDDTMGLDSIPEIIYISGLEEYDPDAIFVTEETDEKTLEELPDDSNPLLQPLTLISDPIDRSKFMKKYLLKLFEIYQAENKDVDVDLLKCVTVKELIEKYDSTNVWNSVAEERSIITGATSSITCVAKGKVIFTVIVNYITGNIFIASDAGIFNVDISEITTESEIYLEGMFDKKNILSFPELKTRKEKVEFDDYKRFTTFLGKTGYKENFDYSMIFMEKEDIDEYLHHKQPGGPSRVLYLSELQDSETPLGFIMYNGEKITEWIHALTFVKFARKYDGSKALRIFEISTNRSLNKDGILMSTLPAYSIFNMRNSQHFININMLKNFDSPSHYRSMLVIAPSDNDWILRVMKQHKYREISTCL